MTTVEEKIRALRALLEVEKGQGCEVSRSVVCDLELKIGLLQEGVKSERKRILELIEDCLVDTRKKHSVTTSLRLYEMELILESLKERIKKE